MFPGNMDTDEHGQFVVRIGAVNHAGFHHQHMFLQKIEFPAFYDNVGGAVQRIENFQFLMPVQREVAAGRCRVGDRDTGILYAGDDLVLGSSFHRVVSSCSYHKG